ncbi:unnamed protein product [Caenorhabditis angaria]|uniref:Serpin domain-containing protein n=1 Tax=Caenorhabditis angaria TaxID=860376 RepID=A0A9P1ITP1_9PELO|nr:unnamed protein product [Caenorhabditis angaria]
MSDNQEKMALLLESETNFGLSLLRQQDLSNSTIFSPVSIALALSLVHLAAKGETRNQIRDALAKGSTDEEFEAHFSALNSALLNATKGTEVNIANHIFSSDSHPPKPQYLLDAQKLYHANASSLDFSNTDATADAINAFVKENTKGHIKEIVKPLSITPDLIAVLVDFLHAFRATKRFIETDTWQVAQFAYKDDTFSFHVFLPKTRFGLAEALKGLNAATLQQLLANNETELLNVHLPKIHIEIGIRDAFEQNADLSNFADEIYVSKVTHKALIDVDEDGTTAAAATTVDFMTKSAIMHLKEPIVFKADHPFLFVLAKDTHPLFIGTHV